VTDRLVRMIERLQTQRACLDWAAAAIADVPGPVLEIGLGKGRTYSHLRALLPEREIYAFDRHIHAPADAQPDDAHVILGDFQDTVPAAAERFTGRAALIHLDFGSNKPARDEALAAALAPGVAVLAAPGGIVMADRPLDLGGFEPLTVPAAAAAFPYYLYRKPA